MSGNVDRYVADMVLLALLNAHVGALDRFVVTHGMNLPSPLRASLRDHLKSVVRMTQTIDAAKAPAP